MNDLFVIDIMKLCLYSLCLQRIEVSYFVVTLGNVELKDFC